MRVSAKCDYACKALLELSLHWPNEKPLQIHTISEKQDIPMKYLVQILLQLKRMKLVESIRGKDGGYILANLPKNIGLGEVMREIGGPLLPIANSSGEKSSIFATVWDQVEKSIAEVLDKISFEDLANKAKSMEEAISYQI